MLLPSTQYLENYDEVVPYSAQSQHIEDKVGDTFMPLLEPVTPEMLRNYRYFMDWLKELNRQPEEVADFSLNREVQEIPSDTEWKKFELTDTFTATLNFKDGYYVSRDGKWNEYLYFCEC